MSDNKTLRSTVSYLIARDHAHELVFAKALESLGVNWGKVLPIPNFDATQYPEVKKIDGPRCAPKAAPLSAR